MQRAAKLDLALDIDDLAAAKPHLGGDAARRAERKVAERDDREAIDLTDRLAIGLDADRPAADLSCRRRSMRSPRWICASIAACTSASPTTSLRASAASWSDSRSRSTMARTLAGVCGISCEPRRLFDDARDGPPIERPQRLAALHRADQPRIKQRRFGRTLDPVSKSAAILNKSENSSS